MPDNNLSPTNLFYQGREAYAVKEYEEAIALFCEASRLIEEAKTDPEANQHLLTLNTILENSLYNALLVAYTQTRKLDLALNNLTAALKIDPNHAATYLNGGLLYQYKGDYPQALKYYQKAIDLKNNMAHFYKGTIHYAVGQFKETLQAYTKAYPHLNSRKKLAVEHDIADILQKPADMLLEVPKKTLLRAIMLLPTDKRIAILADCMNKKTALGERFHKKEGLLACSIHKKDSNLGRAYAELIKLKPDFVMDKPTTIMTYGTLYAPSQAEPNLEAPKPSISKKLIS